MAILYVTEFAAIGRDTAGKQTLLPTEPPLAEQTAVIGVGSVASSAFNAGTSLVRIHTDAICSISFGATPTATATNRRMAANSTEYFAVPIGYSYKVAVIVNT